MPHPRVRTAGDDVRARALLGVLGALTFLMMACVEPTPTPTAVLTATTGPTPTTTATPVPTSTPTPTPTSTMVSSIPTSPTPAPRPTPTAKPTTPQTIAPTPTPMSATLETVVTFPDEKLAAAIRDALGNAPGEAITASELAELKRLDAEGRGIADLRGIERCVNLAFLDLDANRITDISSLAPLSSLELLTLAQNQITDISPVGSLTNLAFLGLPGNQVTDISSLQSLTNLLFLDLSNNQVTDLSPLASLTSLTRLDLSGAQIADLSPLAPLTNLIGLDLANNRITDVSHLAPPSSLLKLRLEYNQITDISPLASLSSLQEVELHHNQITDISPLACLSGLEELQLQSNPLDLSEGSEDLENIRALQSRGVGVDHDPIPEQARGTISGHVYEADEETPIANVPVFVEDYKTGKWVDGTNTRQDGSYTLTLPTGSYRVGACPSCSDMAGYVHEWYDGVIGHDEGTLVGVTAPDETPGIDFTLEVGGTISGHVYKADGRTPIANVHVLAEDFQTGEWMEGTNTSQDGSYTLTLPTGSYRVGVCPSCSSMAAYVREWHDGAIRYDEASLVEVTAPDDTPGIDFTLEAGGTISGHVYQADGRTPVANVHVLAEDFQTGEWMEGTNTSQDGSYTLTLPTGSYRVGACPTCSGMAGYVREWYAGVIRSDDATPVEVIAPESTPSIDFTLEVGGAVSGHVYKADGRTAIANVKVYAEQQQTEGWTIYVMTKHDGSYTLSLPSGLYRLRADPFYSGLTKYVEVQWFDRASGGDDASLVSVTAPDGTPGIDFTLEALGTISGHVYQANRETPAGNVDVYAERDQGGVGMAGARTKQDGSYTLFLPSGTYRVGICPSCSGLRGYAEQWYNRAYSRDDARSVSVTGPDDTSNIHFTLTAGTGDFGQTVGPDHLGQWIPVSEVPVAGWFAAMLPTGKVLLFQNGSSMALFDPKTRQFSATFFSNTNLFCAGLAFLADGRLLAVGGDQGQDPAEHFLGLKSAEIFDPWLEQWIRIPDMAAGERWYPTAITLPDGRVLVASGTHAGESNEALEILDPQRLQWKVVADQDLPLYPWAAVIPQGEVLFYGPQREAQLFDPALATFRSAGSRELERDGGTGVLLNSKTGKVLTLGGGGEPTTRSADIFDPSENLWKPAGSMSYARHHPDAVLLPDGRVLVVGGHSGHSEGEEAEDDEGEPLPAELFDPERETWHEVARTQFGHGYHSTSLLLPDGSVMAAGPGENLEVYFPWYFYRERPVLEATPGTVTYGQTFSVETPDAPEIAKVVAIRLSSVTHSLNTDQRYVELEFSWSEDGLLMEAPAQPTVAPPGYYLLFILTADEVPSEGAIVHVGSADD